MRKKIVYVISSHGDTMGGLLRATKFVEIETSSTIGSTINIIYMIRHVFKSNDRNFA